MRQILSGVGLALVSLCASLLLVEFAARWLAPPYATETGELFSCHPQLGWTGTPHFAGTLEGPGFEQALQFNSQGMHDTDHPVASDNPRVLMLGDSFVHAVQVAEVDTAHQQLENRLGMEVISAGVVNWGTNQQLLYYQTQGRLCQPDTVLLMVYLGNDILDNLPGNVLTIDGVNCYAPYFALCNDILTPLTYAPGFSRLDGSCNRQVFINGMGWMYQHSAVYRQLEPLIIANQPRQAFGQAYPSAFSALYISPPEEVLSQGWEVMQATITHLHAEVVADGAQLGVVIISPDVVVRLGALPPDAQQEFLADNPLFGEADLG
ncbi:MAG: hypothetical protein F6K39_47110, partial [Okeania sp. SIO3B3]|nr:hypothetical protein [Okeania sp. SIO3B3]